jgi:hypothetical protein
VFVCVREREVETEKERGRERGREGGRECKSFFLCFHHFIFHLNRETSGKERKAAKEEEEK